MLDKLLIICCYFDYHLKHKLIDVKIGFGPSGKIETVKCEICKKVYIRNNNNNNIKLKIVFVIILIFFIGILFF